MKDRRKKQGQAGINSNSNHQCCARLTAAAPVGSTFEAADDGSCLAALVRWLACHSSGLIVVWLVGLLTWLHPTAQLCCMELGTWGAGLACAEAYWQM
jgi:hypothetical protein